jgi:hypothetical protein
MGRCNRRRRCGRLSLRKYWLFGRPCPGRGLFCGSAAYVGVGLLPESYAVTPEGEAK